MGLEQAASGELLSQEEPGFRAGRKRRKGLSGEGEPNLL